MISEKPEITKGMLNGVEAAIRGYEWNLAEGLSPQAEDNLRPAAEFLIKFLMDSGTAS